MSQSSEKDTSANGWMMAIGIIVAVLACVWYLNRDALDGKAPEIVSCLARQKTRCEEIAKELQTNNGGCKVVPVWD